MASDERARRLFEIIDDHLAGTISAEEAMRRIRDLMAELELESETWTPR
jgi:hypothetical protein